MSTAGVTVVWKDEGLRKLQDTLEELGKLRVTTGVQGKDALATYKDGTRVGAVAKFNEFGTRTIPARGFMRRAVKLSGDDLARAAAEGIGGVVSRGESPVDGLSPVGAVMAEAVQESINSSEQWATPNAPSTIEKKGPGKPPLHDTERLAQSISWAVKQGQQVKKEGRP